MLDKLPDQSILALGLTIITAVVRVLYDKEEIRPIRVALEATLCGCLSVAISFALSAISVAPEWSVFAGGLIGFLGADFCRYIAKRHVSKSL